MKTRWKILIIVGIFMAVSCVVSFVTMRVQPENKVEAYKKLLRAQGEKLEIAELLPAPVPAASNSVDAVRDAFRMFGSGDVKVPDAMKMIAPGKALIGWNQPEVVGYNFTNTWEDFAAEVAANQSAIDLLQQVMERPKLDFQLDYTKKFELLLPHLAPMKRASQKLAATAIFNLHGGDTGAATTNILTLLALVQKNGAEGVLISHLVRIAMTAIAVSPTWELLQTTNVTDVQLVALEESWQQLDLLGTTTNAFITERAWSVSMIEKARASHEEFQKMTGGWSSSASGSAVSSWSWPPDWEEITAKPRDAAGEAMWRSSWSYADELRMMQAQQAVLETLRAMQTNPSQFYKADYDTMTKRLSSLGATRGNRAFFRALNIHDYGEVFSFWDSGGNVVVQKSLRIETAGRMVRTAIALKRFQLKHGKWPETLNELVPEFIAAVPIDPYDGKLLKYHPNAYGTYLLYSVAENGVDDGGDSALLPAVTSTSLQWQNPKVRDWVWPQPATAEEIKAYYDAEAAKAAAEAAAEMPAPPEIVPPPPVPAGTN